MRTVRISGLEVSVQPEASKDGGRCLGVWLSFTNGRTEANGDLLAALADLLDSTSGVRGIDAGATGLFVKTACTFDVDVSRLVEVIYDLLEQWAHTLSPVQVKNFGINLPKVSHQIS